MGAWTTISIYPVENVDLDEIEGEVRSNISEVEADWDPYCRSIGLNKHDSYGCFNLRMTNWLPHGRGKKGIMSLLRKISSEKIKLVYQFSGDNTSSAGILKVYLPEKERFFKKVEERRGYILSQLGQEDAEIEDYSNIRSEEDVILYPYSRAGFNKERDHLKEVESIYGFKPIVNYL